MSSIDDRTRLRRLAFLYLRMAHQSDDYLSDTELESVTRKLASRSPYGEGMEVRRIVMEALDDYMETDDVAITAAAAATSLGEGLSREQKRDILEDLRQIAEADGILHRAEKDMLRSVAAIWGVSANPASASEGEEVWGVLHDLAYIYLVLAHGTDFDLSDTELRVMLNKLREWQPAVSSAEARDVLSSALGAYAEGGADDRLKEAIQSVRMSLPREQRLTALNDLVKIANADGVFLDNEEDLLNHLVSEWELD